MKKIASSLTYSKTTIEKYIRKLIHFGMIEKDPEIKTLILKKNAERSISWSLKRKG